MSSPSARPLIYLRPVGLLPVAQAPPGARTLAGGRFAFVLAEVIWRGDEGVRRFVAPLVEILSWGAFKGEAVAARLDTLLAALTAPRPALAGVGLDRPRLMAVLNVTPDSFSDGGLFADPERAIARGLDLQAAGADIIDVGGESTRPGAAPVSAEEELRRVLPVVAALAARGVRVSIDTRHALVMRAALAAGAMLLNDVTALAGDPASLGLAVQAQVPVVLMHMQGDPGTMQDEPVYADVLLDVYDALEARVAACTAAGLPLGHIAVDPGIGFGKSLTHNLDLLRGLTLFHGLGAALLVGVSRKRFIAALSQGEPPTARLPGTLAASQAALSAGTQLLRIHDPAECAQARAVWEALNPAG